MHPCLQMCKQAGNIGTTTKEGKWRPQSPTLLYINECQRGHPVTEQELLQIIDRAREERTTALDLRSKQLSALPSAIGRLQDLRALILSHNQLTQLPREIGQLTNLTVLDVRHNQLTQLPPEIGQLTRLKLLILSANRLRQVPPEIGRLTRLVNLVLRQNRLSEVPRELGDLRGLKILSLGGNELTQLPPEIGQLTDLQRLVLGGNELTQLPPEIGGLANLTHFSLSRNHLSELPDEICQLIRLTGLMLSVNQLTQLPPEIGLLTDLSQLVLRGNQLTELPPSIGQLTGLTELVLSENRLSRLPPEIGGLTSLSRLNLRGNLLSQLPPQMGQLGKVSDLHLENNQFTTLPAEIGELTSLQTLVLSANQLATLPLEMGQLTSLQSLDLNGNPLSSPPPEIVQQGTSAVLTYLRERLESSVQQWLSKLLLVGEGGAGKTSLVRALLGETFEAQLPTTHGIEIRSLELQHPAESEVTMRLSAWDFGGQQIYHATHQFFLTNRSLFLLVWNARHGYEQGKLYHWMDTIQALAPDSPVLVVATHIDERDADLPYSDLKRAYAQIIAPCKVSNLDGRGVAELRDKIARAAADLPLMGELWPTTWLSAAEAVRTMSERYITPSELSEITVEHQVSDQEGDVLAQWLHELGDILYFQHDDELRDVVILQPQWVSGHISRVLESEEVIASKGIFTRTHMHELWSDLDPAMRSHFLNLMERFDLSYRTHENREISLVVERLPLDPPAYNTPWQAITEQQPCNEIAMRFHLSTIPAGIPTWFIARSHRFTTHTHWRQGALFADGPEREHLALVQAFPHERYLQLAVRGPSPHNFFALLKDGIELTLNRFPGLRVDRRIPCPGHDGQPCSHEFDYNQLVKRLQKKSHIECLESMEDVSVVRLLFGVHWADPTESMLMSRLDVLENTIVQGQEETRGVVRTEVAQSREWAQREFTKLFRLEQSKIESHCPNIFALRPRETSDWRKAIAGRKVDLQLYCQAPGQWHPTQEDGLYQLDEPAEWIVATAPYIRRLASVLKFATPLINPVLGVALPDYREVIKNDLDLINQLVLALPDLQEETGIRLTETLDQATDGVEAQRAEGSALRALRLLLDKKDPRHHWGGLEKVLTPEGHYLWLCEAHARAYKQ